MLKMKSIDELKRKIKEEIIKATEKEDTEKVLQYNKILSFIKSKENDMIIIKEALVNIEAFLNGDHSKNIEKSIIESSDVVKIISNKLPPEGTECRFEYKKITYQAKIENNRIHVEGKGVFSSLSKASRSITNNFRNGWRDWKFRLPGEINWILADTWRRNNTFSKPKIFLDNQSNLEENIFNPNQRLICKGKDAIAYGKKTQNGFVVFENSTCNIEETNSLQQRYRGLRLQLIKEGILIKDGNVYRFIRNHSFNSPSEAACVVLARSANGITEWRIND